MPFNLDTLINPGQPEQTYRSYSSSCRVMIWHYVEPNPDPNETDISKIMEVEQIDLRSTRTDNPIISFTYSKTNNSASGAFQLVLNPTANWMQRCKPGDWIAIYLSNGVQKEQLRCIGTIDSILMNESISNANGARSSHYTITGQDYGKIFEKYWIYITPFLLNTKMFEMMIPSILGQINGSTGKLIQILLDVFLSSKSSATSQFQIPQYLKQWMVPGELAAVLQEPPTDEFGAIVPTSTFPKFYDILDTTTVRKDLPGQIIIWLLNINNTLWNIMKENSNPIINELFCEMNSDGRPGITLRTIPFAFKNYNAPTNIADTLTRFGDLESVKISGSQILGSLVSLTENLRYNYTLLTSAQLDFGGDPKYTIGLLSGKFPFINTPSCNRYGLMPLEGTSNTLLMNNKSVPDTSLLFSWNDLLKHFQINNAYFEGINLQIMGDTGIRIGKRMDIVDGPLLEGMARGVTRSYYIESYVDNWTYPSSWVQSVIGTRGVFIKNGEEKFTYELMSKDHTFTSASAFRR